MQLSRAEAKLAADRFLQECQRTLPGELGVLIVIGSTGRVGEGVIRVISVQIVIGACRLQRALESGNHGGDRRRVRPPL